MSTLDKQFNQNTAIYVSAELFSRLITFFAIPVYAYLLDPAQIANYYIYIPLASIVSILSVANIYTYVPRYLYSKSVNEKAMISSFVNFIIITSVVCAFVLYLIASLTSFPLSTLICVLSAALFVSLNSVFRLYYEAKKEAKKVLILKVILNGGAVLFNVSFIYFIDRSPDLVLFFGIIFSSVAAFLYSLFLNKSNFAFQIDLKLVRQSLDYSMPLIPYALSFFVIAMMDKLLIAEFFSKHEAGYYSIVFVLGTALNLPIGAMFTAWLPNLFGQLAKQDYDSIEKESIKIFRIALIACLLYACLGRFVLGIFFDDRYSEALSILPIFVVTSYLYAFYSYNVKVISYYKKTLALSFIGIGAALLSLGVSVFILMNFDYQYVCYSLLVTYFFLVIATEIVLQKFNLPLISVTRNLGKVAILLLVSIGAMYF